ncbi:MAG: cation:proton antiporter [Candidatus Nanopelagicales bacterium]
MAVTVAAIGRWRGFNPAIALIAAGLALEFIFPSVTAGDLDPELILSLVLAPLVFAAGLASSAVDLRRVRRSVLLLAVGLVVITTFAVGWAVSAVVGLSFAAACALGAILAPTDAVAASSVAKKIGLPQRVQLVIEGESLANDGTALTILRVAVAAAGAAAVAGSITLFDAAEILFLAVVGGIAVGVIGGFAVSWLIRLSGVPVIVNSILIITPFALYRISEAIEGSGLLTMVIAGVWIAHTTYASSQYESRIQATAVWSLITFLLEALAFCLVGVELFETASGVTQAPKWGLLALVVSITLLLFLLRATFMGLWFLLGPKLASRAFEDRRSTAKDFIAISLLGVRGPVSVLAAFSIPADFTGRAFVITLTFGVVILSLLLTTVASPIIDRLNLSTETDEHSLAHARASVAKAALKRLDEIVTEADRNGDPISESMVNRLRSMAVRRVELHTAEPDRAAEVKTHVRTMRSIQREMLQAERSALVRLERTTKTPGPVIRDLTNDIDIRQRAIS